MADNEVCYDCHSDDELTTEHRGQEISLFVDNEIFSRSVHMDMECIDCHSDADVEDFPHPEELEAVNCGECHDDELVDMFVQPSHGVVVGIGEAFRKIGGRKIVL